MKILLQFLALTLFLVACNQAEKPKEEKEVPKPAQPETHDEWSKNATIYEVNIRQHTPEGTFKAFETDIPRLQKMGIKILWLMPVHPIGEKNRKGTKGSYYSVKDYKAVNPEFGTMEDFRALVQTAHEYDMKVIIDWVANHTAFDNVWTETNMDYYNLDSLGKLQPPEGTDWWDVADLDYDNPQTRAAMIDAMQFWLRDGGIDGFRCDVASFVPTDFWEACRDSLETVKPDVFMLAEANAPELLEKAFDMDYAWEFMHIMNEIAKGEKELAALDDYRLKLDSIYQEDDYKMYFTTNHDENCWNGTVMERYGEEGHKTYAVLAFTFGDMPLVYSGQEAGMDYALEFFEKDTVQWGDYKLQDFYSALLKLNLENSALWNGQYGGTFERIGSLHDEVIYAYHRKKDENEVVVVLNFSGKEVSTKFEGLPEGDFLSLFQAVEYSKLSGDEISLAPYAYHVFYK
jgi:1,4-alpha-glucan branching enzyme